VALVALWFSILSTRHSQQTAIKESSDVIFKEWWSEEVRELRRYFFLEFIPQHRAKLICKGMKSIEQIVPEDMGRATRLCAFFDRIGWLGASGLLEVDYVLGPMQHVMRRTWIVMEPLIQKERELTLDKITFDPVFQYGFEWLFKRSNQIQKHQAYLLKKLFLHPHIHSREEINILKEYINSDEATFCQYLQRILENPA
jgi:hypothetical protein